MRQAAERTGDAVKSLFERQLDIAPGASWVGFDQLGFLLGAWLFALPAGAPPFLHVVAIAPIVFLGAIATTLTGFLLGLKRRGSEPRPIPERSPPRRVRSPMHRRVAGVAPARAGKPGSQS